VVKEEGEKQQDGPQGKRGVCCLRNATAAAELLAWAVFTSAGEEEQQRQTLETEVWSSDTKDPSCLLHKFLGFYLSLALDLSHELRSSQWLDYSTIDLLLWCLS